MIDYPMCDACWIARHGRVQPERRKRARREECSWCGMFTRSGIWSRSKGDGPYPQGAAPVVADRGR